jgi:hypothetical protein
MKANVLLVASGVSLFGALLAARAEASFPAAVFAKVDQVTMLPDETNPTEVLVHGVFFVWSGTGPAGAQWGQMGFENARAGYMYYTCPAGQDATCRMEWSDLKKSIGNSCRGYGAQNQPGGTVRDDKICPKGADKYPLGLGVVQAYSPCIELDKVVLGTPSSCDAGAPADDASGPPTTGAGGSSTTGSSTTGSSSTTTTSATTGATSTTGGGGAKAGSGGASSATAGAGQDSLPGDGGCAVSTGHHDKSASLIPFALAALALARRSRERPVFAGRRTKERDAR